MPFFANFRMHEGHQFRLDTRIYLRPDGEPSNHDTCIAATIAKNPGSAKPTQLDCLTRLSLGGDNLLPYVRNRFLAAYHKAGAEIPTGAYVQVWNLLYICHPELKTAIRIFQTVQEPLTCDTERNRPPIVWFAWGPPHRYLRQFTPRFLRCDYQFPFYYDIESGRVVASVPELGSRVRHTQGLPKRAIEDHLASLVG